MGNILPSLFLMVSAAIAVLGVLFSSATHYVRIAAAAASIPTMYSQTEVNPPARAQTIVMRSSALMIFPNVLLVQRPIAFAQRGLLLCAIWEG